MKVSRLSFPTNSPAQGKSPGRVYLDMIDGVLNVVTNGIATPVGDVPVTYASTDLTDKTAAGVAMFTAANAAAQLALINGASKYLTVVEDDTEDLVLALTNHANYIRKDFATACSITIPKQSVVTWVAGTYFTVKNVGAGTLTITPVDSDVTIVGTDEVATGSAVKVIRIASNSWEVVPFA
jgi:archaellum component FlaG (FlaF/FlaG flagellin family)